MLISRDVPRADQQFSRTTWYRRRRTEARSRTIELHGDAHLQLRNLQTTGKHLNEQRVCYARCITTLVPLLNTTFQGYFR